MLIQSLLLAGGNGRVLHGMLFDPDCYMHLQRALRMMTGGWQPQGFDPRINAPFGFAIHWTSLFDTLLAVGTWPLTWFRVDPRDALYIWGSAISPLTLMLSLAVFAAGVRPWIEGPSFLWLTVLIFTQPYLSGAFLLEATGSSQLDPRPDAGAAGLALCHAGWALERRAHGARRCFCRRCGGCRALCTTVEGLLTILPVSLVMALAWSCYAQTVLSCWRAIGPVSAATLIWLVATNGSAIFKPAYDHVSVVHARSWASALPQS